MELCPSTIIINKPLVSSIPKNISFDNAKTNQNLPVILRVGSNVSIFSMRSIANGLTWGNTCLNCWRGCGGSCRMYLLASSLWRNPRSASVGVPSSWRKRKHGSVMKCNGVRNYWSLITAIQSVHLYPYERKQWNATSIKAISSVAFIYSFFPRIKWYIYSVTNCQKRNCNIS